MSNWNGYVEDGLQSRGRGSVFLPPPDPILQPEHSGDGKNESILPASKWAREDDENDNESRERNTKDLGLTYSSSGSENAGDGPNKTEEIEVTTDASNSTHLDSGMNEEQRNLDDIISHSCL